MSIVKYLIAAVALLGLVACSDGFKPRDLIANSIEVNQGCSGVLLDETHILTAAHCTNFGKQSTHRVRINESWFTAYLVKFDEKKDLAILAVPGVHFQGGIKLAKEDVDIGDTVYLVGRPQGLFPDTVTKGSVSAVFRDKKGGGWDDEAILHQLDISGAPGNSGSGVFNDKGELVGVLIRGIKSDYEFSSNYLFSVTLKDIRDFLNAR